MGQDAELLDALCQNASMIEYECLSRDRPNTASAKLDLAWQRDMSISPKDVNLGSSVQIEPHKTKDPGDATGETRVVQRSRNGQGKQDGESASTGSFAGTLPEKILLVFDDMLYLIEQKAIPGKKTVGSQIPGGMVHVCGRFCGDGNWKEERGTMEEQENASRPARNGGKDARTWH